MIQTWIQSDPIFKRSLRATLIDGGIGALCDHAIEVVHGLDIEKMD